MGRTLLHHDNENTPYGTHSERLKFVQSSYLNHDFRSAERLNLNKGRWEAMQGMLSRRSTLGVAVLAGCLYAVGGFDGNCGLDSVEKYDPGECVDG